ncbi:hypothetical protein KUX74_23005, partial [Salmonella enterica subsp. enterica serovar Montevideo]|nr:hypothetical protein [Salmonella enterica subsp. enterica serovar Montevideo]
NTNVEEVAVSQEQQNSAVPMPELEQANQALVAQNGTQEYAPHASRYPSSRVRRRYWCSARF